MNILVVTNGKGNAITTKVDISNDGIVWENCLNGINRRDIISVILPGGIKRIEHDTFKRCANLRIINIPSGIEEIGDRAFQGCYNLESPVRIPSSTKRIGEHAFSICRKLECVILEEGVEEIGNNAFASTNIESITIPSSVKRMGMQVFASCKRLTIVNIPKTMTMLTWGTFLGCSSLNNIMVPNGTIIEPEVFQGCGNLETICGSIDISYAMYSFRGCEKLKFLSISDSSEHVAIGSFIDCKSLKEVFIPAKVKDIAFAAFLNCRSLEYVNLPMGLELIEGSAFHKCSSLNKITVMGDTSIDDTSFDVHTAVHRIGMVRR